MGESIKSEVQKVPWRNASCMSELRRREAADLQLRLKVPEGHENLLENVAFLGLACRDLREAIEYQADLGDTSGMLDRYNDAFSNYCMGLSMLHNIAALHELDEDPDAPVL